MMLGRIKVGGTSMDVSTQMSFGCDCSFSTSCQNQRGTPSKIWLARMQVNSCRAYSSSASLSNSAFAGHLIRIDWSEHS